MGEFEGHNIPGKRPSMEQLANSALVTVISRAAMVLVVGVLIWGFNRVDGSITKLNDTIVNIQIQQGILESRVSSLERARLAP